MQEHISHGHLAFFGAYATINIALFYIAAQEHPWFIQGMWWRQFFGWVTAAGVALLIWDLMRIGAGETKAARQIISHDDLEAPLAGTRSPAPAE